MLISVLFPIDDTIEEMWKWQRELDPTVNRAFQQVERVQFLPESLVQYAALDEPLPIGEGQTISQPYIVAVMVQALQLQPGDKVLEIGTGSGYEAAILCEITAQADHAKGETVYSIERIPELAHQAETVLHRLGYQPNLRVGDGAQGWPEAAPFDAIIVSAAGPKLSVKWWQQLAERGRLVVPLAGEDEAQFLWTITKTEGEPTWENLGEVRFVPLLSPLFEEPTNESNQE